MSDENTIIINAVKAEMWVQLKWIIGTLLFCFGFIGGMIKHYYRKVEKIKDELVEKSEFGALTKKVDTIENRLHDHETNLTVHTEKA